MLVDLWEPEIPMFNCQWHLNADDAYFSIDFNCTWNEYKWESSVFIHTTLRSYIVRDTKGK